MASFLQSLDTFRNRMDKDFQASFNDIREASTDTNALSRIFAKESRRLSSSSISCMEKSREAAWYISLIGRVPNIITCIGDRDSS